MNIKNFLMVIAFVCSGLSTLPSQCKFETIEVGAVVKRPGKIETMEIDFVKAKPSEISNACKCYCSDLCGPRDRKEDDAPFFDKETGQCFCKERDKINYIPHGCHLQPKTEFESNCCSAKE